MPAQEHLTQLRKILAKQFSKDDLRVFCFDLGVDYDDLDGGNKTTKATDLVAQMARQGRLADLVAEGRKQ